jgi:hypothetical protein
MHHLELPKLIFGHETVCTVSSSSCSARDVLVLCGRKGRPKYWSHNSDGCVKPWVVGQQVQAVAFRGAEWLGQIAVTQ